MEQPAPQVPWLLRPVTYVALIVVGAIALSALVLLSATIDLSRAVTSLLLAGIVLAGIGAIASAGVAWLERQAYERHSALERRMKDHQDERISLLLELLDAKSHGANGNGGISPEAVNAIRQLNRNMPGRDVTAT